MLSSIYDKENIMDEVLVTTPLRKPLTTLQVAAQSTNSGNTPSHLHRKTPKQGSQLLQTPVSHRKSRKVKRKSMPSKVGSIFEETSMATILADDKSSEVIFGEIQGQALNELLREKVYETISKMKEKYELCLVEKDKCLEEKTVMISHLQNVVNYFKNTTSASHVFANDKSVDNSTNREDEDDQIEMFVEEILKTAVNDLSEEVEKNCLVISDSEQARKMVDAETWTSPVKQSNLATEMTPLKYNSVATSPITVDYKDSGCQMTPVRTTSMETTMTPLDDHVTESTQTVVEQDFTNEDQSPLLVGRSGSFLRRDSLKIHTMSLQTDMATSMTPVLTIDNHTAMTPKQSHHKAACTSPLMAALQPHVINTLPINTLRTELASAAISNELLRAECDELNNRIVRLEQHLQQTEDKATNDVDLLQKKADLLQHDLNKAVDAMRELEAKKPHSVQEYDDVIKMLQNQMLMKEKQIAFYCKKATETDNLQKDLCRMYAKYNTEHESLIKLQEDMDGMKEAHILRCTEYDAVTAELCTVKNELDVAVGKLEQQTMISEEARQTKVRCSHLEEQLELLQSQQKENIDFMEQERQGLEETAVELEQSVKSCTFELDATKEALVLKTEQYEQLRETRHSLRTQLKDVQDELNAVQSQAYMLMLSQEKELTTVSRALEQAWVKISAMIDAYKQQACNEGVNYETGLQVDIDADTTVKTAEEISTSYKPSLVHQVLAAVSSGIKQADVNNESSEDSKSSTQDDILQSTKQDDKARAEQELTLMDRAVKFDQLLTELEEYASVESVNEHSQIIIQQYVDEIANLKDELAEKAQMFKKELEQVKEYADNENMLVRKLQREHEAKDMHVEQLKFDLQNVQEESRASRKRIEEMSDKYCRLIEQEIKNEELSRTLEEVQRHHDKMEAEKMNMEKNLEEVMEKLKESISVSEQYDVDERKVKYQQNFTELLAKKLKLQREVDKLRESGSKCTMEKEKYAQYSARLEAKVNILASNLNKAEEEIYRLDGVVDRFCSIAQANKEMAVHSQDLCKLLAELNIVIE